MDIENEKAEPHRRPVMLDIDTHRELKVRAAREDRQLKDIVHELVTAYLATPIPPKR